MCSQFLLQAFPYMEEPDYSALKEMRGGSEQTSRFPLKKDRSIPPSREAVNNTI